MTAEVQKILARARRRAADEAKSEREWRKAGNKEQADYRAGASNEMLEFADWLTRRFP